MSSTLEERIEKVHDYSQQSIDDSRMIVGNSSPKLTYQENISIITSFASSSQDRIIENNTNKILTYVLNRCNENKSSLHPSKYALKFSCFVALKVYAISLKEFYLSFVIYSKSDLLCVVMLP